MKELSFFNITTLEEVVEIVLIVERNGEQRLVYYISEVLHCIEMRNQKIKKLAYVNVLASRRLKHYF